MLVELGPGTAPRHDTTVGIDLHHPIGSPPQDATRTPWQVFRHVEGYVTNEGGSYRLGDNVADEVFSSHFMEHIHRGQPLLNVMNEVHRVLKSGGTFTIVCPLVGYTDPYTGTPESNHIGWQPWADPTHVNYWWFPEALWYFCEGPFKPNADYGVATWAPMGPYVDEKDIPNLFERRVESFWSVRNGWEGVARLVKP